MIAFNCDRLIRTKRLRGTKGSWNFNTPEVNINQVDNQTKGGWEREWKRVEGLSFRYE